MKLSGRLLSWKSKWNLFSPRPKNPNLVLNPSILLNALTNFSLKSLFKVSKFVVKNLISFSITLPPDVGCDVGFAVSVIKV